jgi:hypothetical protein
LETNQNNPQNILTRNIKKKKTRRSKSAAKRR